MLFFQGAVFLKEYRKMSFRLDTILFRLFGFIWIVIPNSNTGLGKAFLVFAKMVFGISKFLQFLANNEQQTLHNFYQRN